jgi:pSer/pThr/pTyr-binding forkhead associated (FHA) protein
VPSANLRGLQGAASGHPGGCRSQDAHGNGCGVKVINQELPEGSEIETAIPPRAAQRQRPAGPPRLAPLTGVLMTDLNGALVVRRVRVRVTSGPDRGREALLEAGTLLVGTHTDNDLILRDPQVGKYHLEIALVAGGIRVRDLGSESGTFVNAARVGTGVVSVGTEISIGRSTLQLLVGDLTVPVIPSERTSFGPVSGQSVAMRTLFAVLERIAATDTPILLEGDVGTGRTLIAKAVHASSRFAASPITAIDLRLPTSERPSLAQVSQRSDTFTLLLERIDEASNADMSALLSIYERREEGVLDARILATCTADIKRAAAEGRFRKDLANHVAAVRLLVPSLSARVDDIPMLIRQFAREICGAEPQFRDEDFARAVAREYPGNVRELRGLIVKALQVETAPPVLPKAGAARARAALVMPLNARPKPPPPKVARDRIVEFFERDRLQVLYDRLGGDLNELSRELNCPRKEVLRFLKAQGVQVAEK